MFSFRLRFRSGSCLSWLRAIAADIGAIRVLMPKLVAAKRRAGVSSARMRRYGHVGASRQTIDESPPEAAGRADDRGVDRVAEGTQVFDGVVLVFGPILDYVDSCTTPFLIGPPWEPSFLIQGSIGHVLDSAVTPCDAAAPGGGHL